MRFISDFWKVNACLDRIPYPIPKISDVIQHLEEFHYTTTLDLNMEYCTIYLDPFSQEVCTTFTPWEEYTYLHVHIGFMCTSEFFKNICQHLWKI